MSTPRVFVGALRSPNATGSQAVTGVGFTPKALILWSANTAISVPEFNDYAYWSFGLTDGSSHVSMSSVGSDGFSPDMQQKIDTAAVILAADTGGTTQHRATLTSLDADGFTLDWTAIFSSERRYYNFIAIGGDGVSVKVSSFNGNTSTGTQAVTGVGFAPTAAIFAPFQNSGTSLDECSIPALGWTDGTHQAAACVWSQDFGSVDTKRYQRTSKCLALLNVATGALLGEAGLVSLDADGFTVNWTTAPASSLPVYYLATKNIPMACGTLTQPTSAGDQTVTGAGFRPGAVALMSVNAATSASIQDHNDFSLGAASATAAVSVWLGDKDATATVQAARYYSQAYAYAVGTVAATGTASTLAAAATLSAFTADGFTLAWGTVDATAREILWLAFYDAYADDLDFDSLDQQSGDVIGLTWVELYHKNSSGAAATYLWAPVDLTDPSTYYGGFKEARLIGMGQINRGLSDRLGQYEAAEWSFTVSDTDRLIRGFFDRQATRHLLNRMVLARMIDDDSRRSGRRPRLLVRGLIRDYQPRGPLHFEFIARDHIASKFGPANLEKQIPQRTITRADFPDCPVEAIGAPVPIVYGQLSESGSANPAPVITGTGSRGAFVDSGLQYCGFGDLTSSAAVPTGVTLSTPNPGTVSAEIADATYGVWVTAVDSSGRETNPDCMYVRANGNGGRGSFASVVETVTVDGTKAITVSWSAAAGAAKYRVYLAGYYYGPQVIQMIEVTAPTTTCEFTTSPAGGVQVTSANITPGATIPTWYQRHYYAVSAVYADGETALSAECVADWVGYRRVFRVEWIAPAVAPLSYKVYRRETTEWGLASTNAFTRVWTVPVGTTTFDDDNLDTNVTIIEGANVPTGAVPVRYVGTVADLSGNTWERFLVCGHAVKEITALYQNGEKVDEALYGDTWAVPGQTGYTTYFANTGSPQYVDIHGRRYTCIMGRGAAADLAKSGDKPLTVNVQGIEDVGDGSGTLLESLTDIYRHAVTNWLFQSYESGAWLDAPLWPTDVDGTITSQVDESSFDAVAEIHAARLAGGYPGAIVFGANGELITLRDAVARLNLSADCQAGFNRNSQFFVSAYDHRPAVVTAARAYTQVHDIVKDSLQITPKTDEVENVVVYSFKRRYADTAKPWDAAAVELRDEDAIADLQEERRSPAIELYGVRSAAVAQDIAQRRRALYRDPPQIVSFETNLKGLGSELGDVITVDHIGGTGASGWTARPVRVLRHVTTPDRYLVRLECVDVQRLYEADAHDAIAAAGVGSTDPLDASGFWMTRPARGAEEIVRPF